MSIYTRYIFKWKRFQAHVVVIHISINVTHFACSHKPSMHTWRRYSIMEYYICTNGVTGRTDSRTARSICTTYCTHTLVILLTRPDLFECAVGFGLLHRQSTCAPANPFFARLYRFGHENQSELSEGRIYTNLYIYIYMDCLWISRRSRCVCVYV